MGKGVRGLVAAICWLCLGLGPAQALAGQLGLSADQIEFGQLKEGLVAEKVVTLTNHGAALLQIKNVRTS